MIEIDGSHGEGGGQVLRTSLSLACVKGIGVRIKNIRAGREKGGLGMQHLAVANALAKICGAKMQGANLGSSQLEFEPGEIIGGKYEFDIGSAGSVTLLAQALLPVLCSAKKESEITIVGGTHVRGAPFFDYFENVFLGCAKKFKVDANVQMQNAGFYPKGGGKIMLWARPSKIRPCAILGQWEEKTRCRIYSCGLPAHVASVEEGELLAQFKAKEKILQVAHAGCAAQCAANAIALWKGGIGACCLGERGKKAKQVALEAAQKYFAEEESGCAVDSHCADQLLLYMAGANGECSVKTSKISMHAATNMEIIRKICGTEFEIKKEGGAHVITSRVV